MNRADTSTERSWSQTERPPRAPTFRRVPPAITPLRGTDLAAGYLDHRSGRGLEQFRDSIVEFLDATGCGTYTSFRRALAACLLELRETSAERTVAVPAFCSSDYRDAIEGAGLEMRRYDVDPGSLAADLASLKALPFDDLLAVITVNVLGYTSPMASIARTCARQDTYLVEALGYALGASYEGQRLGTYGDCAVLNFQQGKPIPVGGGMVVSQSDSLGFDDEGREAVSHNALVLTGYTFFSHPRPYDVYSRVTGLVNEYLDTDAVASTHPENKFDVAYERPFKTMSNFQGAVGVRVFERLAEHRRQRLANANYYREVLDGVQGLEQLSETPGTETHQYVRYPILVEPERREQLQRALAAVGIGATTLYDWPPIDETEFPGGASLQSRILTLPTHPYVTADDRRRIRDTITAVLDP